MPPTERTNPLTRLAIVGAGRMGMALAHVLRGSELDVIGPIGHGELTPAVIRSMLACDAVLLCVPDAAIAAVAATVPVGPLVGHCSGATGLEPLAPHESFSLHPLTSIASPVAFGGPAADNPFRGVTAAIDGSTAGAEALAEALARRLGMLRVRMCAEDRAAYHAAASVASNFLVTLEAAAERLADTAGVQRAALLPLVRATVTNWAALGAERALTGPVARGDETTVSRQREAVAQRAPELLELFDAMVNATRALASGERDADARDPGTQAPDAPELVR